MGWMRAVLGARWFPYAAIAVVVTLTGVFGYGYMKGYGSAEKTYQEAMNKALADQLERLTTIHAKDMATAARQQTRVNNVRLRIKDVERPDCVLSPECLRAFNDGVRASGANPKGVD